MVARRETNAQQRKVLTLAGDNGRENAVAPADTNDTTALGNYELSGRNQKAAVDQKSDAESREVQILPTDGVAISPASKHPH